MFSPVFVCFYRFFLRPHMCAIQKMDILRLSHFLLWCLKFYIKKYHKKKSIVRLKLNCKKNAVFWKKNVVNACQFHKSPYLCTRFREATLLRLTQETRLRCWKIARRNRSLTDCEQYDKAVRLMKMSNTKNKLSTIVPVSAEPSSLELCRAQPIEDEVNSRNKRIKQESLAENRQSLLSAMVE